MEPNEKEVLASLERDARLMRELRATEMWDCLVFQLRKMETRALEALIRGSTPIDEVNYWRGQLAALKEVQAVPDLIIRWAEDAKP